MLVRGSHSSSSALSEVGKAHQGNHQTSGSACTIAGFDSRLPRLPPIGGMALTRASVIGDRYMSFHVAVRSGIGYVLRFSEKTFRTIFSRNVTGASRFQTGDCASPICKRAGPGVATCLELRWAVR